MIKVPEKCVVMLQSESGASRIEEEDQDLDDDQLRDWKDLKDSLKPKSSSTSELSKGYAYFGPQDSGTQS